MVSAGKSALEFQDHGVPASVQWGNAWPDESTMTVTAGTVHTCALMWGRTIHCWGENYDGQLGNGTLEGSPTSVQVLGFGERNSVTRCS